MALDRLTGGLPGMSLLSGKKNKLCEELAKKTAEQLNQLGLYRPQSGEVLIHGVPAAALPDREKRWIFGYVDQAFQLIPGTVRDQITLFDPSITDEMVYTAAKRTGLHAVIGQLEQGYDTVCTPDLFSQGQRQLLVIARAVAAEPQILLLDEITANLDAGTEQMVLDALSSISADRTVISISHRLYQRTGGRQILISSGC